MPNIFRVSVPQRLSAARVRPHKILQNLRNYVQKVLEKVLRDVRNNRRFDSLQEEINNIAKRQEGEHNLEVNAQIWHSQAEQLRDLLESDKKANEEDRKEMMSLAQESDARVDHAIFLNSAKLSYAERWAKAKLEQQELKLKLRKTDMLNELSDCTKEYSAEQVVSAEMTAYLEADIRVKEKQVVEWTKRYNEEVAQLQWEIDELKREVEEQKFEIGEMRALRDRRQEFIDECVAEEKRLQEEARYWKKLNKAATIIQAMWKGYMVRRKLENLREKMKNRKKLKRAKKAHVKKR
ncbi:hypothetical protein EAI_08378 [Harpegnathos saltator]|uniref:Dynein regulatory complex protein 9 n=1 Tax=Harpegnathos saltator TaxID=610380 RepID=E2BUZ5_HARSA|nr:hypothetical protein EAI_08378 [Harpegnathos saltator]